MNAVVEISGKQFKVAKDSKLYVHRLDAKEGSKVSFDNVLLLDNGSKVVVGTPTVTGASVEAKVVKHLKDDKVIVFKKKSCAKLDEISIDKIHLLGYSFIVIIYLNG